METLSMKALMIAVGVFISLAVTSAILFTLNQITQVYQGVYTTDISIQKEFTEFAMYNETVMTGLEMCNTAKKYKDKPNINVQSSMSGGNNINTQTWINAISTTDRNHTSRLYDVTYTTTANEVVTIFFRGR